MTPLNVDVRRQVIERAGQCCEYCRIAFEERLIAFHIDHIIALKHGGLDSIENLSYACYKCKGFKGPNIASIDPQTANLTFLFNPRSQRWQDHFQLKETLIEPLTAEGRVTVILLRLNDDNRLQQCRALVDLGRYPCLNA